jgi:hypothetical protein
MRRGLLVVGCWLFSALVSSSSSVDVPIRVIDRAEQGGAAVAWDGTNFLAVWQDARSRSGHDLFAGRVATNGQLLDTAGIAIAVAPGEQLAPAVAFNGTNYLVVWQDARSGNDDVRGVRVSPAGVVLDDPPLTIATGPSNQRAPSVAAAAGVFLGGVLSEGPG